MSEKNCEFPLIVTGYLSIKYQNGFNLKQNPKKMRFVKLFARSSQGIERLEISDSETDKNTRIVTLENCIKITPEPQEGNVINVITKCGQLILQCANETETNLWTKQLQSVAFNDKLGTFKRNSIVEYNELYCSSFSEGKFTVNLVQTDISVKNNLEPKLYILELTTTEIQLKNYDDEALIHKWPYRYIRKYGYRDGKFTFEAGRKCDTGEGTFKLDHANPQEIFRCMSAKMKSMKKLLTSDSSGSLDSNDNQLNIAISMEAGSRSPLPPINSPTSPDTEMSLVSHASLRGFLSSTDSVNLSFLAGPAPPTPPIKNAPVLIPNKPPRRTIHITNSNDRINNNFHEALVSLDSPPTPPERNKSMGRDYECIENITDAWKTLGIGEVKHTEHVTTPDDELQEFAWQRSKSFNRNESKKISVVDIKESSNKLDDESDYDKLEFFPTKSTTKNSSNYKTIVPIIPPKEKKTPVSDDYEIITPTELQPSTSHGEKDLQLAPSRLADDSYLGYGVIRKTSLTKPGVSSTSIPFTSSSSTTQTVGLIDHQKIPSNGLDYAIVSKPKRV